MRAFVSSRMATTTVLALLVPTLVHFASAAPAPKEPAPKEEESATVQESDEIEAGEELRAVLTQPLDDFNLTRKEIPPELVRIRVNPYVAPSAMTCAAFAQEIVAIDKLVGPDLEILSPAAEKEIFSKENATNAARNVARSAASSWIPFRDLVREVTGAERHARALREAVLAGFVRRSYMKGLSQARRCPAVKTAVAAMPAK